MYFENHVSEDGSVHTIELTDKFDFEMVKQFRESYTTLGPEVASLVIDLKRTRYMDSSALGMLLNMEKTLNGRVGKIRLINCQESILNIFKIARFDKKFSIES